MITEREREREELKSEIADLEAITNRTAEQEQKLKGLKEKLAKLESGSQGGDQKKPTNWTPWIIGGGVVILVIIAYLFLKNREGENGQ